MKKITCPFTDCATAVTIPLEKITSKHYERSCPKCKRSIKVYDFLSDKEQVNILAKEKEHEENRKNFENSFGYILVEKTDKTIEKLSLTKKKTEIGRKATTSTADVQIPTEDMTMSRMHFFLEYVHSAKPFFKLSKSKDMNGTYVMVNKILNENNKLELREMKSNEIARLEDGEIIIAGATRIIVKVDPSDENEIFAKMNKDGFPKTMIS
jgi:hypothetical protein